MLKLRGFIAPFLGSVALAVVLLFVQAFCDLNLPNLMSDIVNVGIQQGGVERGTPQAMTKNAYSLTRIFANDTGKALLEKSYQLTSARDAASDGGGKSYSELYPKVEGSQLYVLRSDLSSEQLSVLDDLFGVVTWTMMFTSQDVGGMLGAAPDAAGQADSGGGTDSGTDSVTDSSADSSAMPSIDAQSVDFEQLASALPSLELLPSATFDKARTQANAIDPDMRKQSAVMYARIALADLGVDLGGVEMRYILNTGIFMLLIALLGGAVSIAIGYFSARVGAGVARDLRLAVFAKVSQFSHAEFDRFSTASLITRSTNDITQMQQVITMGIRMLLYSPIMAIGATAMALNKSLSMGWTIGIAVVFLLGLATVLLVVLMPKFRLIQKLIDRINLVARETLNGLMVVRAFGRSKFEEQRFEQANDTFTKLNLFVQRAMVVMMPALMLFMNGLTVLIIWMGANEVAASQMQVGDMMAYLQYAMMVVMSFMFLAMMFVFLPRAQVSAGRIVEVLETEPQIKDPTQPVSLDATQRGRVEFQNVSFRYDGAELNSICNISFVAQPGTTTAFIGSTGSGKSTILNLIPRFYDVREGAVLVGGVDVRNLAQHELRSRIGYVPQAGQLTAGTIASNIAFGNNSLAREDVAKFAQIAQASDFINSREDGFESEIAQGGSNVSGGQRQRLSIARALAIQPDIYLFDDSFSALDYRTDAALRKALHEHTNDATLIIVAQRVSTIMDADQIIMVDDGAVVGKGTHRELLTTCPAYLEIAQSQLTPEELELELGGSKL